MKAQAVRLHAKAAEAAALAPAVETVELPDPAPGVALIRIAAAGVNPSDVKAGLGLMPYAVFPRTTGRDFAGTVLAGPDGLVGRAVFGSSGDLGIRRDGTHASHLLVEADALVAKPAGITLEEAAGIGVPFVTAAEGLRRAGLPQPGETVLVMGVNGKVGQAAVQIATWRGARVIGVVRRAEGYEGHASSPVTIIDASAMDVPDAVRDATGGRGADIVYNTVGDPYYPAAAASLAKGGPANPDRLHQCPAGVRHLRLLPRPPHLCRHRHPGAVLHRDRRRAALPAARLRSRCIEALPDHGRLAIYAGQRTRRFCCRAGCLPRQDRAGAQLRYG